MEYTQVENRIVRDDGFVAMQHINTNGANVQIGGVTYVFIPTRNVALSWVAPEHIGRMMEVKTRACCGNRNKQKFVLASLINTNIYVYGSREGKQE